MTIAILQVLFAAAACYGLWRCWRALGGRGRASQLITFGFLIRALGGHVLFWISWLRLPIARSLQLGDGFWFFAVDGPWYLGYARDLLAHGPKAIVFVSWIYASRIFTQWFTIFAGAFGVVASTGILFNCFLYLATCGLIFRIARDDRPRDFALAAIAFGPATILWSLQLLKDTFFIFLIVAMVAVWSEWQRLWREDVLRRALSIAICAVAMWYAVYAIAGTRWYAGAIVASVSLLFLGLVANLPRPRFAASAIAVLLFLTLGQAFLLGGDLDVPMKVRNALDVQAMFHPGAQAETAKQLLKTARRGFETTSGNTVIAPGRVLLASAAPLANKPPEPEPPAELPVMTKSISSRLLEPAEKKTTPKPQPPPVIAAAVLAPAPAPAHVPAPALVPPTTAAPPAAPVVTPTVAPASTETIAAVAKPAPPAEPKHHAHVSVPKKKAAPVAVVAQPQPKLAMPPVQPKPAARPAAPPVEQSLVTKIATGAAAMFIPRVLAQPAGLVRIGGGRGFWLFADLDTVAFDLVVFFALAFCLRAIVRRERAMTPLFILVLLVFAGLTGPMIYTVTNFGTLFRLRGMVYVLAAVLPLTLDLRTPERAPDEDQSASAPA